MEARKLRKMIYTPLRRIPIGEAVQRADGTYALRIANLKAGYPNLVRWQEQAKQAATRRQYTQTLSFAKSEDNSIIDTVLGMLLQSFSK